MFQINDTVKLLKSNKTGKIIRISNNNKYTIELENNSNMVKFLNQICAKLFFSILLQQVK